MVLTPSSPPSTGVFMKDEEGVLGEGMRRKLLSFVEEMERKCENKIWHPDSNSTVLDLIHPSLYPFELGKSKLFKNRYHGDPGSYENLLPPPGPLKSLLAILGDVKKSKEEAVERGWFKDILWDDKYQWLPSDVKVEPDGTPHFISYIAGLIGTREIDRELYKIMEVMLAGMIPLFEKALSYTIAKRDEEEGVNYNLSKKEVSSLKGKVIQVIPTLRSTLLAPWNPEYPGGNYHCEGMDNERIVAVGLYYFSVQNISKSLVWLRRTGMGVDLRTVGEFEVREGRSVVFPNQLEHRVDPFQLKDNKSSGARRVMAFFLVDPTTPILSTANVFPPGYGPEEAKKTLEKMREHRKRLSQPIVQSAIPDTHMQPNRMQQQFYSGGALLWRGLRGD